MDWGSIISAAANAAGAIASSRAKGRADEAEVSTEYDKGTLDRYKVDKQTDLDALIAEYEAKLKQADGILAERQAELAEPQQLASNSVRGDVLANVQDVTVDAPDGVNVTKFSGGLRPSLLSGNSRALGQQMSKEALLDALDPDATPSPYSSMDALDLSSITSRTAPTQTELEEPSALDKAMEQIALWGSLAGIGTTAATSSSSLKTRALPKGTASTTATAPTSNPFE